MIAHSAALYVRVNEIKTIFLLHSPTGNTIRMANINSGLYTLCDIGRHLSDRNVGRRNQVVRSDHPHGTVRHLFDDIVLQQILCALA